MTPQNRVQDVDGLVDLLLADDQRGDEAEDARGEHVGDEPTVPQLTKQVARDLLRQLNGNEEVQARLCWTVTAIFYSALHLVHARLAVLGLHPQSHRGPVGTWALVMMRPEFAPIRRHYSDLMDKSEQARYRFRRFSAALVAKLLVRDLQHVNDHIRALGRS